MNDNTNGVSMSPDQSTIFSNIPTRDKSMGPYKIWDEDRKTSRFKVQGDTAVHGPPALAHMKIVLYWKWNMSFCVFYLLYF